jgi:hypothetical protein
MNLAQIREKIYHQHDVVCNQKYADYLPYSFHIKTVEAQGEKFMHLIEGKHIKNTENSFSNPVWFKDVVRLSLSGHDLIEDARFTYNNVKDLATELGNTVAGEMVADIVYCVTDEKGKSRRERKNYKYYKELCENKLAVFVKLADLSANTLFSKLTGSSMYDKYKSEFPNFKDKVYIDEYKEFFDYLESI